MKLALLGGGGFRVPLVFRTLLSDPAEDPVTELRLMDPDVERAAVIEKILTDMAEGAERAPRIVRCETLEDAVTGVDFVFSAFRVGGTAGRAADERIGRELGILGQETTGFGGISYALRGLPVARDVARTIAEINPDAWVINFTNPAGIVTEATADILGDRVIGICDSPVGLGRRVLTALESAELVPAGTAARIGVDPGVHLDYAGLNHLGWLTGITVDGEEVLPRLLERDDLIESFEEGRLFGAEWVRTLGCVPNEYLHYYYYARDAREADEAAEATRGVFLQAQQTDFYARAAELDAAQAHELWEATRLAREETYMATNRAAAGDVERDDEDLESGGYDRVALAIMHAIAHDVPTELILNVRNRGLIDFLPEDAVVEVPCRVDRQGVHPLSDPHIPLHGRGLVHAVKTAERAAIRASREGSRELAVEALALHPLVDGVTVARRAVDAMTSTFDELDYLR